jgi:hypothetical protein
LADLVAAFVEPPYDKLVLSTRTVLRTAVTLNRSAGFTVKGWRAGDTVGISL